MVERKTYTYRGIEFFVPYEYKDDYGDIIYRPTLNRIKNLIDMAAAIRNAPPPVFNMQTYCSIPEINDDVWEELEKIEIYATDMEPNEFFKAKDVIHGSCGTSACAIGTAAYNGIGKAHLFSDWSGYAERAFGICSGKVWEYVFDQNWSWHDNTADGAAARILQLVIDGPRKINYRYWDVKQYQKFKEIQIS